MKSLRMSLLQYIVYRIHFLIRKNFLAIFWFYFCNPKRTNVPIFGHVSLRTEISIT